MTFYGDIGVTSTEAACKDQSYLFDAGSVTTLISHDATFFCKKFTELMFKQFGKSKPN